LDRADWVLGELSSLAVMIELTEARLSELYAQRSDLFRQAKACTPPVMNRVIAEHAGVSQPRVSQKLAEAVAREQV
jgi:hypothetical protein